MASPREKNSLTQSQQRAVAARGNVLVMAGAGTGKTHTLVARVLHLLAEEKISIDEILIVTFTEAAAAEMRSRLRNAIEKKVATQNETFNLPPATFNFWREQLALFDLAHIGTLHSFCLKLIRENFHRLGLDPQLSILDEGAAFQLAAEILDEQFTAHYENQKNFSAAVQNLIQTYGNGRDEKIRELILRLHHYSQTRPDAELWLTQQIGFFSVAEPTQWRELFFSAIQNFRDEWLPILENLKSENEKAAELFSLLKNLTGKFLRETVAEILSQIISADNNWPARRKTILRKSLEKIFEDAKFLHSYARIENGVDPLAQDWDWIRGHMKTLLQLAQEFAENFSARKRSDAVLDFHDLEQFALKLLREPDIAQKWREKFRFIFVDEYQDINAAQDKIIQSLSSGTGVSPVSSKISSHGQDARATIGNRFLVGDVKQSIYRFRLADPKIFRDYAKNWRGEIDQTIALSENFRSREPLLNFVNSLFGQLMREEIGGVNYDADAKLKFGQRWSETPSSPDCNLGSRNSRPTELLLRIQNHAEENADENPELADLEESQKEARLIANHLQELVSVKNKNEIWDDEKKIFRAVEWRDVAILLRSPRGKAEIFAQEFSRAQIPLLVARGGFFDSSEILDLLSLLELLDNPLQDVPCISVLRSPLVGCSLDELAQIRLAGSGHFWFALNQAQIPKSKVQNETRAKIEKFLGRFHRWRKLAQQSSLSQCLETILAETHYDDWLKSRPRGAQKFANVRRFLNLAEKFDQLQRQGLFRFLKFVETQREIEAEPEISPVADENAVRLMSIHQSKGLEFPVVAVADLAKNFNTQDLRGEIIFDAEFGLCSQVNPPKTGGRYPSLPFWLAQKKQRRELCGEELRLLYVAMTRARDNLILTGGVTGKKWETLWAETGAVTPQKILAAKSYADWLGLWFANQVQSGREGELPNLRWRIADDAELAVENAECGMRNAETELPALDEEAKSKLQKTLEWQYEFDAATKRAAKSSVTALRHQAADESEDEAEQIFPLRRNVRTKLSAADAGTATHKFLQHFNFNSAETLKSLEAEAERLVREKVLSADERAALVLENVAAFWNSRAGEKFLKQSANVKRELAFTAKFSPQELDEIRGLEPAAGLEREFVVVQGVADLVVLLPAEIWLVDFKTDEVRPNELAGKTKNYSTQMKLYASALAKIYSRPVTNCWLHFLPARKTVDVKI
jgi:ATP-dependent helicase/nuclease subunit A